MTQSREAIRDPKPSVDRIQVLANRILEGDILLPKFQRDFVWNRQQILELLDSIQNNYPIGSVLLWLSRQKLRSETAIAGLEIKERAEEYPVNYLLDGQQRLSSICGALFWDRKDKDSVWNISYDLRHQEFIHLQTLDDPPLHQIRLNKLPDASCYFQHVASLDTLQAEDKDTLKERAEDLFNRFKDYSIAAVTLHDMPIESVAPIFERINSTGTRLTIVDLMRAATWSEEFDLIDTIDGDVLDAIADKGFGTVERKAVLRTLSEAAGGGFSSDSIDNLRQKSVQELKDAAAETVEAYKRATDFLSIELGIPNAEIIPYINEIVVILAVFRRKNTLTASEHQALKRWFWRTTLSGYFSGWNTGQMAADLAAIERFVSGDSDELEVNAIQPNLSVWMARQFRANNAHAKMLGLMLSQKDPRDLITGQRISLHVALAWENSKEYHHFFPQAFLRGQGYESRKINSVANFVLLSSGSNKKISDSKPSIYLRECERSLGDRFAEVREANLINELAYEAALDDDFDSFLSEHAEYLHRYASDLCGWA